MIIIRLHSSRVDLEKRCMIKLRPNEKENVLISKQRFKIPFLPRCDYLTKLNVVLKNEDFFV